MHLLLGHTFSDTKDFKHCMISLDVSVLKSDAAYAWVLVGVSLSLNVVLIAILIICARKRYDAKPKKQLRNWLIFVKQDTFFSSELVGVKVNRGNPVRK